MAIAAHGVRIGGMNTPLLRPAEPRDLPGIVGLIGELAEFENLTHLLKVTPESLAPHLFGPRPVAECLLGEVDGEVVAFALFFTNFSTFLGKPGLYLEDLYVKPAHRRSGLGQALFLGLTRRLLARKLGLARLLSEPCELSLARGLSLAREL